MAKGTLTFTLPEEEADFKEAQEGPQWKYLLMDILHHLRAEIKYGSGSGEKKAAFEEIQQLIWNSIEDRKLKAD